MDKSIPRVKALASNRVVRFTALAFATTAALVSPATIAAYPERPIRILLTTAPGAAIDITARLVAEHMSRTLKQQVVVENQPGGAGNVALGLVANAPADGYTLAMSATTYVAAPYLFTKIPYDPVKSFIPVSMLVTFNNMLVTGPQSPVTSMADFIARAKANPGGVSVGGGNLGGQSWIMTMKLNTMAGIKLNYIAYKGSGPALVDTMGGHTDSAFSDPASIKTLVSEGKLRPLAVTSMKRTKSFPDVPAIGELVPGYDDLGFVRLRGLPNEEPLLSVAMAELGHDRSVGNLGGGRGRRCDRDERQPAGGKADGRLHRRAVPERRAAAARARLSDAADRAGLGRRA